MRGGRLLVIRDLIGELGEIEGTKFLAIGIQATICIPYVRAGKLAAMMAVHDDDRPGAERAFLRPTTANRPMKPTSACAAQMAPIAGALTPPRRASTGKAASWAMLDR